MFLLYLTSAFSQYSHINSQEVSPMTDFPSDLVLWQGMSLAGTLTIIVQLLKQFGIFEKNKKLIPFVLSLASGIAAGAFYFTAANPVDPIYVLYNFVAGVIIGFNAVGFHSAVKNTVEYFKK